MVTKKEKEALAKEAELIAERDLYLKYIRAGAYMLEVRGKNSLNKVGEAIGFSGSLLGYIERGRKVPSDHFLTVWSAYFGVDEDSLFERWNKIPILAKDEIRNNDTLRATVLEIARNKKLSADEKDELYDDIHETMKRYLIRKEGK